MNGTQELDRNLLNERQQWLAEHMGKEAAEPSSLMAVLPAEADRDALKTILAPCQWTLYWATSCEEAIRFARHTRPRIVLCEDKLPDGGWRRIWKALSIGPRPPLLIVASRTADETLWAAVLNAGAHDVLLQPFRSQEVIWALHCAATRIGDGATCHASPASA